MNCFIVAETAPDLALTVQNNSMESGAKIVLSHFTGNPNQIFRVLGSLIICQSSQLVIDVNDSNGIQSGINIIQNSPLKNDQQCFLCQPDGTIFNPKLNLCFTPKTNITNGVEIIACTPNGSPSQKFRCITKKY